MAEFLPPRHQVPQPFSPKQEKPPPPSAQASAAAPAPSGRPTGSTAPDPAAPPARRQIVCFSFYKLLPEWRRLPAADRAAHKSAFAAVLERWNQPGEFLSLTYSTIGTRGDVDFCVWTIGYAVDELNQMRSRIWRERVGSFWRASVRSVAM